MWALAWTVYDRLSTWAPRTAGAGISGISRGALEQAGSRALFDEVMGVAPEGVVEADGEFLSSAEGWVRYLHATHRAPAAARRGGQRAVCGVVWSVTIIMFLLPVY